MHLWVTLSLRSMKIFGRGKKPAAGPFMPWGLDTRKGRRFMPSLGSPPPPMIPLFSWTNRPYCLEAPTSSGRYVLLLFHMPQSVAAIVRATLRRAFWGDNPPSFQETY